MWIYTTKQSKQMIDLNKTSVIEIFKQTDDDCDICAWMENSNSVFTLFVGSEEECQIELEFIKNQLNKEI